MNKLLRYIFFLLILSTGNDDVFAQVNNLRRNNIPAARFRSNRNPKLEAARNRFIGQQLSLTDAEARKFWPLYNQYQEELKAVRIAKRINSADSDISASEQVDKELSYDTQMLTIRKRYKDEFMKFLSPAKVGQLYKSEQEFTDELIKQLSERSVRAGN